MSGELGADVLERVTAFVQRLVCGLRRRDRGLALTYVLGLLSSGERKSVEPLMRKLSGKPQPARERRMRGMLSDGKWSAQSMMQCGAEELVSESAGWTAYALDDTAILKRGSHSAGVSRQYAGCVGHTAMCQSIVTMSIAQDAASALVRAELFLPERWFGPRASARRARSRIPQHLTEHVPKWQMALDFVRSRQSSTLPQLPYLFDAGYGTTTEFRAALAAMGEQYVGGVTLDISVWPEGTTFVAQERKAGAGRPPVQLVAADRRKPASVESVARGLPASAWKVVHWRDGSRGPQRSRFAATRVRAARGASTRGAIHPRDVREEEWLLLHWPEDAKGPTKAWLSNLGPDATLTDLVRLARVRWRIERDHQECKELLGFDHYEGRTWPGLHHHLALVLLSHQILALERLRVINDGDARREPALFPPVDRKAGRDSICTCRSDHGRDRSPRVLLVPDVLAAET